MARQELLGQWLTRIEEDERHRTATPPEERRRRRAQELRDLRRYLKKDGRFTQVTCQARRLADGPARREILRRFWQSVYDDPLRPAETGTMFLLSWEGASQHLHFDTPGSMMYHRSRAYEIVGCAFTRHPRPGELGRR
jgi:hypothetical protein